MAVRSTPGTDDVDVEQVGEADECEDHDLSADPFESARRRHPVFSNGGEDAGDVVDDDECDQGVDQAVESAQESADRGFESGQAEAGLDRGPDSFD